ncbi:MAG: O-antigen ligase family protein [Oscillospiraceae bacterium]|jgi:hypothetical protein|nr:O-antigen ligase family protein [Oscillospiraceae bacterium]
MERTRRFSRQMEAARQFLLSGWGLVAQAALAGLVIIFHMEVAGMVAFVLLFSVVVVVSDNLLATSPALLFASLFLIKCHDSLQVFLPFWWLVFLPVGALVFHLVAYHRPLQRGKAFWPLLAVSFAVTLGGLGAISAKEYFAGVSLYHMAALGFGMLFFYVLLGSYIRAEKGFDLTLWFTRLMLAVGLLACFMVLHHYLEHLPLVLEKRTILPFQWRNNISSFLMLAMPFAFSRAVKRPWCLPAGLLMYGCILLSGSRGGMLFGFLELLMCLALLLFADRKRRILYLVIAGLGLLAALLFLRELVSFLSPAFLRLLMIFAPGEQEVRELLYARAVQDFRNHPLFGVGLGFMGNRDVHPSKDFALCWYHNAPLQVLGSMGLVGVAAYLYQTVVRCVIFLRRRTVFHLTLFVAWVGIEMMSLVNPGVFAPVPYLLLVTMFVLLAEKTDAPAKQADAPEETIAEDTPLQH